jgi:hypothetical protein
LISAAQEVKNFQLEQ